MSSQHERDASMRKTKRLEEELETIRVYYRYAIMIAFNTFLLLVCCT